MQPLFLRRTQDRQSLSYVEIEKTDLIPFNNRNMENKVQSALFILEVMKCKGTQQKERVLYSGSVAVEYHEG